MKKPYLKKIKKEGDFAFFRVDGNFIRTNIDEEFTNFGYHLRFDFIPENEVWIDDEMSPGEEEYYIDDTFTFLKDIEKGKSHEEAVKESDIVEKREREKSELAKKAHEKISHKEGVLDMIHKKKLALSNSKINIWLVNGELVRDLYLLGFTEGGHDKVYHFVPKNEVWIDDDVHPKERKFVLIHELHERNLMSRGMDYNSAHKKSSQIEFFCRHNHCQIDKELKLELKKIKN